MSISEEYIKQYKIMHKSNEGMFPGQQTLHVKDYINRMKNLYDCNSILDYGCGKGYQYTRYFVHNEWNCPVTLFDIGVDDISIKPNYKVDFVVSTDVLEHCEEAAITEILKELNDYAEKCVLVSISTREAKKTLPDGRNAHLTVKPGDWWLEKIKEVADKPWFILFENATGNDVNRMFELNSVNMNTVDFDKIKGE